MEKSQQKNSFYQGWEETDLENGCRTSMLQTLSKFLTHFEIQQKEEHPKSFGKTVLRHQKLSKTHANSQVEDLPPSSNEDAPLPTSMICSNKTSRASSKKVLSPVSELRSSISHNLSKCFQTQQQFKNKRVRHLNSLAGSTSPSSPEQNKGDDLDAQQKQETYESWKRLSQSNLIKQKSILEARKISLNRRQIRLKVLCLWQRPLASGKNSTRSKMNYWQKVKTPFISEKEFEDMRMFRG